MADEDGVTQVELAKHLDDVLRVPAQAGVAPDVVCGEVGAARADVVEQDDPVVVLERGREWRHMFWSQP